MKGYRITNLDNVGPGRVSFMGEFLGEDADDALNTMARAFGRKDFADHAAATDHKRERMDVQEIPVQSYTVRAIWSGLRMGPYVATSEEMAIDMACREHFDRNLYEVLAGNPRSTVSDLFAVGW